MFRNTLRGALLISLLVLMSPAYMPALLHVVAFVTERPVTVDTRAGGYRVEEGEPTIGRPATAGDRTVTLTADPRGHFQTEASINGHAVEMMVDTGATSVALRQEDIGRLGLRPVLPSAYTVPISTANGTAKAARILLAEIRIGRVRVKNVEALVMPERSLGTNLLGMSFIRRLSNVEMVGNRLTFSE
jgi:aspartyl protease family protein